MKLRTGTGAAAAAVAVLLVTGACGAPDSNGVETPSATSAPPPATEPAPDPPGPPPEPVASPPPEPAPQTAPAEPPEPAEEPPTQPAAPPEPPADPAPSPTETLEEPEAASEPPPAPPTASEPQEVAGELLDEATIAALAARLASAQESVSSLQLRAYMSLTASLPGEPPVALQDVPLMTLIEVGDRARAEVDMGGLMAGFAGTSGGDPEVPMLPPLEMILEGETELYLRLASLLALDPDGELPPWLTDQLAEQDGDISELWGFVDLAGAGGAEALASLGVTPRAGLQDDFVGLLAGGLPEGALLEVRSIGPSEVMGIPTKEYSFVLDLAALSEVPEALGLLFSPDPGPGDSAASPGDFFGGLGGSRPFEFVIHVDSDDLIRRSIVVVDIGAILTRVFDELAQAEGLPEGADPFPELEYVMSMRMDAVVLNDPSLVVELPDPSLVVELPDWILEDGVF
ncbi:MAG: hypothetical protein F4121_02670 [Acidimicrobiia bacterium]|nr:hypothetical protein [Acidimicrobiia bacterium]MYC45879.1 hypothetical protein [Acidimicrobiia bacterium]MYI19008.1 hypothetical protein [Acidimicrobiia bacterium]